MLYRHSNPLLTLLVLLVTMSCDKTIVKPQEGTDTSQKLLRPVLIQEIAEHTQYVFYTDFSADSRWLASGAADRKVVIWNINEQKVHKILQEEYDEIWGIPLQFSPDGKYLAIGSYETLKIFDVRKDFESVQANFAHKKGIQTLYWSPDSKMLATAGVDGRIIVWSVPELEKKQEIQAHPSQIWNIKISPDSKYLFSGGQDSLAKQWSFPDLNLIQTLKYHNQPIEYVDISSDGKELLLGSADSTISVWTIKNLSAPRIIMKGHVGAVLVCKFSADNKYVFSGGDDDEIYIYDTQSGEVKERLQSHFGDVMTIAVSKNRKYIVSGSRDRRVKLWSLEYQ